jgi:hypothetical protein
VSIFYFAQFNPFYYTPLPIPSHLPITQQLSMHIKPFNFVPWFSAGNLVKCKFLGLTPKLLTVTFRGRAWRTTESLHDWWSFLLNFWFLYFSDCSPTQEATCKCPSILPSTPEILKGKSKKCEAPCHSVIVKFCEIVFLNYNGVFVLYPPSTCLHWPNVTFVMGTQLKEISFSLLFLLFLFYI